MNFCPHCGNKVEDSTNFCGNCGQAIPRATHLEGGSTNVTPPAQEGLTTPSSGSPYVAAGTTSPKVTQPVIPPNPTSTPRTSAAREVGSPDLRAVALRIVTGNWIGAAGVAVSAALVGWVLCFVAAVLQLHDRGNVGGMFANGTSSFFAAFGVPLDVKGDGERATLMSAPLLVTFIAAAVAVLVFNRVVANYPEKLSAIGDGIRAALTLAILMIIAMVVVRIIDPSIAATGGGDAYSPGLLIEDTHTVPSVAGTIFIPGVSLALILSAAVMRSNLPTASRVMAAIGDVTAPLVQGLRTLLWCTLPAGLVLVIAGETAPDVNSTLRSLSGDAFGLPNYGIYGYGVGLGSPFGYRVSQSRDEVYRLGGLADQLNWVVWLTIPVVVVVVALVAYVVARTASRERALLSAVAYVMSLLAVLPLIGLAANTLLRYHVGDLTSKLRVGVDLTELAFTMWGASILACAITLLLTRKLTVAHLQARPPQGGAPPS